MADIRINALPTTASASSSDDYIALDGTTNGTRKLNAYSPTFGGNLTVSGTATIGSSADVKLARGPSGSGNLAVTAATDGYCEITARGAAGNLRIFSAYTGGNFNWYWGADASAQTGSNAGSNFVLVAGSDTGGSLGTYLTVNRATAATTLGGNLTVSGTSTIANGTAAAPSLVFAGSTTTGLYRYGANVVGMAMNGLHGFAFNSAGEMYGPGVNGYVSLPSAGGVSLTAGGTNQNITLTPSGTGRTNAYGSIPSSTWSVNDLDSSFNAGLVVGPRGTGSSFGVSTASASSPYPSGLLVDGSYAAPNSTVNIKAVGVCSGGGYGASLAFHTSSNTTLSEVGRFTKAGNFLLGTTTDGGYKLQVSGTASITGAVSIGSTLNFDTGNAAGTRSIVLGSTYNSGTWLILNGSTEIGSISVAGGFKSNVGFRAAVGSGPTTADYGWASSSGFYSPSANVVSLTANNSRVASWSTTAMTLDYTTASTSTTTGALVVSGGVGVAGAANIGGAIAIGNTVQTAASVASTHKVTIVIGGVTYYLLATNI